MFLSLDARMFSEWFRSLRFWVVGAKCMFNDPVPNESRMNLCVNNDKIILALNVASFTLH